MRLLFFGRGRSGIQLLGRLFPPLFQGVLIYFEQVPAEVDIELGDRIFLCELFVKKFDARNACQQTGGIIQGLIDNAFLVLLDQFRVGISVGEGNIIEKVKDLFLNVIEAFNLFMEGPGVKGIPLVLVDHTANFLLLEVVLLPGADVAEAG